MLYLELTVSLCLDTMCVHSVCLYVLYLRTVLLNYNFIVARVFTCSAIRNLQCIPVMCLCGPCFLVVWTMFSRGVEHTRLV